MVRTKEEKDEDLEWFKSTFHPIPRPALPDDCVEYCLYIIDPQIRGDNPKIVQRLREVQKISAELTRDLLKDYIWQRESYRLELAREDGVSVLRGRTNFGDSIEDEWVIVYLLRELSKRFSKDLWIRIVDNDGEFLLIEGVGAGIKALSGPEVAANKTWINDGKLKVIINEGIEDHDVTPVSLQEAKKIILERPERMEHIPDLEDEAFYRLRKYPDQITNGFHHALLCLPRKVAYLLHQKPAYVSPAVEAFYLRDPIALRPLQAKDPSNLILALSDFVTTSIKFPKVAFAQMKSQEFEPPSSWSNRLPQSSELSSTSFEIGMKLTCGFEMLLSDPQNQDKPAIREINMLLNDLDMGDDTLPTDSEITAWTNQNDDEAWMNVKFEDLERELAGSKRENPMSDKTMWTDKDAQDNLHRIVQDFQKFLDDKDTDAEGAGLYMDDGSDSEEDEEGEDDVDTVEDSEEDKEQSFSNEEFEKMMRVMMGVPPKDEDATAAAAKGSSSTAKALKSSGKVEEIDTSDEESEADIEEIMKRVEAELNEAGALDLGSKKARTSKSKSKSAARTIKDMDSKDKGKGKGKGKARKTSNVEEDDWTEDDSQDDFDDDEGEEGGIDYGLLKNLLESFKGQAGTAGPAGNLMGLMGVNLPRDEGEAGSGRTTKPRR